MSSQTYDYDLVCVGAGSGGVRASRFSAANYGAKVAVVELPFGFVSSESVGGAGGTCVIRGCVPKKLLVYGSEFSDSFADSQGFGWSPCKPEFDWNFLVENKGKEIKRLNGIYGSILKNAGVEQVEGRAYLKDAHTVQVFDPNDGSKVLREMTAKNVLIAVGAMAHRLPIPGAEHTITSDEALSLPKQPKKIAIIGAGYIAVEFAGIFGGLGTEVHLFYRKPHPLTGFDQECREMVAENLARRAQLHPECNPVRVEKLDDGQLNFTYKDAQGAEHSMVVDEVMMATGRVPKTKGLGLENIGVEMNKGAVVVDELQRTNVPGVWALGDVTDKIQLTPVALMEGMAFAASCFGGAEKKPDYEHVPSAVFCQPPLAKVGFSEEEAIERFGGNLDVYTSKFKPMKNTLSGREERTLMKMIVHRESDKVVGIHMVGPDAAEIMQGMAVALKAGATKANFDTTVGIHPSAAEEFVTMRSASRSVVGKGTLLP